MDKKILCLFGPTASGKTDLALELASCYPVEIVSVDSALIYKDMDIGTGKPASAVLDKFPHALVDIISPEQAYSAANFVFDVSKAIDEIHARGNYPLLVGGTMLYYNALMYGLNELPSSKPEVRAKISELYEQHGAEYLHAELAKVDSLSASNIHFNDRQRLFRALEVYYISGKALSSYFAEKKTNYKIEQYVNFALLPEEDRRLLYKRIEQRFLNMLDAGFVEEVKMLREKYNLSEDLPSMKSIGYRQVWQYLENVVTYDKMKDEAITSTRQLAKRQMTWLRSWPNVNFLNCGSYTIKEVLHQVISKLPF